jgi:hypothetical protein
MFCESHATWWEECITSHTSLPPNTYEGVHADALHQATIQHDRQSLFCELWSMSNSGPSSDPEAKSDNEDDGTDSTGGHISDDDDIEDMVTVQW